MSIYIYLQICTHRPSAVARRRAESGTCRVQSGDRRGVPRADVRVERHRCVERLRAEAARGPRQRARLAQSARMN
jgi:hypothetical protein